MALEVVGTGLGRTGTKSMQTALEMLGFGPCHHMFEVRAHPESRAWWIEAGEGKPVWDKIFENYRSTVDYPGAAHWRAITDHYPSAKVLHTVRDPNSWFDSTQATIFSPVVLSWQLAGPEADFFKSIFAAIATTPEHMHDRKLMTDYFRRHTEEVKAAIAAERLLIYEVGEGWDRLCRFLGVPVPEAPFPSENTRAEIAGMIQRFQAQQSPPAPPAST